MTQLRHLAGFNPQWTYNGEWLHRLTVVGVQTDWCRLTAYADQVDHDTTMHDCAAWCYEQMGRDGEGHKLRPYTLSGFRGVSLGQASKAYRGDMVLLERRSWLSDAALDQAYADQWRCTRLDLAVDVLARGKDRGLCLAVLEHMLERLETNRQRGAAPLFDPRFNERGETLYVGSRSSNKMLRIYDKSMQQGLPVGDEGRWYRFELELKKDTANAVFHHLVGQSHRREPAIMDYMLGYLRPYGVRIPNLIANGPQRIPGTSRGITDDERTIGWIARSVARPVERLRGAGHGDILDALLSIPGGNNDQTA